jgi:hypothetical protein
VLIPQLIFGGALIKYDEMNHDPDLLHSVQSWFALYPDPKQPDAEAREQAERKLRIPAISRLVATHYSYEGLIVAQAKLNPLTKRQDALEAQITRLAKKKERTPAEDRRFSDLKQALAEVSALQTNSGREMDRRVRMVDKILSGMSLHDSGLASSGTRLSAQRRYTNQKVNDLVFKAESEQNDHRRQPDQRVNVFFSPEKYILGMRISVYAWNSLVLFSSSMALLCLLWWVLSIQLRPQGRMSDS